MRKWPVSVSLYQYICVALTWPPLPFQGEKADSFYIIESGEVSILIKSKVSFCVMVRVTLKKIQMLGVCTESTSLL